ncbi:hypothetical protein BJP34_02100 [Moorena producens PAL-8-15-08-1]|uniref:Uncharacterized protein n=1 Tax=Moorena producens PAL-8-15-08-1 TaxID=1458985 RepID=A0A1D8TL80_9CYAN|nr:hypothetical protein [Moorena producens]AOW98397.1 hypothetical protein BJP34_02100 [Moorena producens PAL-8-15-08-1]
MAGLFKGKKKSKGFYMELDESETSTPEQPAVEQKPEPAKAEATAETAPVEAPLASDAKSARQAKKEELAKAKAEAKAKKKAEAEAKNKAATPEPTPVAALNSAAALVAKGQPETTFATKYVPMIMPRRRPGPSMNKFMDMAAQMQQPR